VCLGGGVLACSTLFWEEECASYLMDCTIIVAEFVRVSHLMACGRVCLVFMSRLLVINREVSATSIFFIYSKYI
jgi:hypothetical protein